MSETIVEKMKREIAEGGVAIKRILISPKAMDDLQRELDLLGPHDLRAPTPFDIPIVVTPHLRPGDWVLEMEPRAKT